MHTALVHDVQADFQHSNAASEAVAAFKHYPLNDCLLQKAVKILLQMLDREGELQMHLLFETGLVPAVISGDQAHLHLLGQKLSGMAEESPDIQEFLDEFYGAEWQQYKERLREYVERGKGWLVEDPRESDNQKLSNLLGLKFAEQELDNFDNPEENDDLRQYGLPLIQADEETTQEDFDRLMMPAEFGDLREESDGADSVKYWSSGRAD